jgi:hypothetical protein
MPIDPEEKPSATEADKEAARRRKPLSSAQRKNRHSAELRSARKKMVQGLELGVFMHERCWSMRPASEVRLWLLHRISLVE